MGPWKTKNLILAMLLMAFMPAAALFALIFYLGGGIFICLALSGVMFFQAVISIVCFSLMLRGQKKGQDKEENAAPDAVSPGFNLPNTDSAPAFVLHRASGEGERLPEVLPGKKLNRMGSDGKLPRMDSDGKQQEAGLDERLPEVLPGKKLNQMGSDGKLARNGSDEKQQEAGLDERLPEVLPGKKLSQMDSDGKLPRMDSDGKRPEAGTGAELREAGPDKALSGVLPDKKENPLDFDYEVSPFDDFDI